MKKLLPIIAIALVITFSIDSFWAGEGVDEVWVLRSVINKAKMIEFTDSLYGYTITYPDFLQQLDDNQPGRNRFCYHGRTDIIIETSVEVSIDELKAHADKISYGSNSVIMSGDYFEGESTYQNMRFHTKTIHSSKRWITYTVIYNKKYEDALQRIKDTIDRWK